MVAQQARFSIDLGNLNETVQGLANEVRIIASATNKLIEVVQEDRDAINELRRDAQQDRATMKALHEDVHQIATDMNALIKIVDSLVRRQNGDRP